MGKPITQPSLKISKKEPNHQLNTRAKVLKPKVYITHSSNFKTLVQKVTGNGSCSSSSSISSFSPPTIPMVSTQPPHVIHIDSPDHSLDFSNDPSLDNTFMSFDYSYSSSEELGFSSTFSSGVHVVSSSEPTEVIQIDDHDSLGPSSDNTYIASDYSYCSTEDLGVKWPQDRVLDYVDEIQLKNLESWLLDFDPSACVHEGPFVPLNTYEYGYNMSSIM